MAAQLQASKLFASSEVSMMAYIVSSFQLNYVPVAESISQAAHHMCVLHPKTVC